MGPTRSHKGSQMPDLEGLTGEEPPSGGIGMFHIPQAPEGEPGRLNRPAG